MLLSFPPIPKLAILGFVNLLQAPGGPNESAGTESAAAGHRSLTETSCHSRSANCFIPEKGFFIPRPSDMAGSAFVRSTVLAQFKCDFDFTHAVKIYLLTPKHPRPVKLLNDWMDQRCPVTI